MPAIYKSQPELARFLRPFEAILLGGSARSAEDGPGLREIIFALPRYLDPETAPEEFLPWLGSWVALSLRADLAPERKRLLIARAATLFQWRGTRSGLHELLQIVTGTLVPAADNASHYAKAVNAEISITEPQLQSLIVGVQSTVGKSTRLGGELPYLFHVNFRLPESFAHDQRSVLEQLVRDTVDLGKPAHTYYELKFTDSAGTPVASALGERTANDVAQTAK